jgi:AcrR family transcriptional regulator
MTTVIPPGRRERKKAQTRKLISDTALRLFLDRGFDHVTVKEVADAADVSPTTVFKHFPVKEALVFDEDPEQQAGLVAAVLDREQGQSVPDALQAHLLQARMFAHQDDPQLRVFLDLVNRTPALREYQRQMLRRHEAALADAIATSTPSLATASPSLATPSPSAAPPAPSAPPVAAIALARYVLNALDIARDQPDPQQAFATLMDLIRPGWPT